MAAIGAMVPKMAQYEKYLLTFKRTLNLQKLKTKPANRNCHICTSKYVGQMYKTFSA